MLFSLLLIFAACSDDDDSSGSNGGNGSGTPPPSIAEFATFDLSGAIDTSHSGISVATNDITSSGSLFTFEHMKPIGEAGGIWKLTFLYNRPDTFEVKTGVYVIGSQESFDQGAADFTATYIEEISQDLLGWNPIDVVSGIVEVLEYNEPFIEGTFELMFSNSPHGELSVANGLFKSRYFENHH